MIALDEKPHRALQLCEEAARAGRLYDHGVVKIAEAGVFEPCHQKSSAEGMRLYAIVPPA
jgi:hypothetical protein